jgi:homeobox protein cut-like
MSPLSLPLSILNIYAAYQTEIDSLTRRCKSAENAFLGVYRLLAEAPDPYPLLELAVDQTIKLSQLNSLESETARLRQENSDLQAKLDAMSGSDREKRKAEKRVEVLEDKLEDLVKERVTAKENELKATYDERFMNYEERFVAPFFACFD